MMALSAGLDDMVWTKLVEENDSIVQNFQSAVDWLKYCVDPEAHRMDLPPSDVHFFGLKKG